MFQQFAWSFSVMFIFIKPLADNIRSQRGMLWVHQRQVCLQFSHTLKVILLFSSWLVQLKYFRSFLMRFLLITRAILSRIIWWIYTYNRVYHSTPVASPSTPSTLNPVESNPSDCHSQFASRYYWFRPCPSTTHSITAQSSIAVRCPTLCCHCRNDTISRMCISHERTTWWDIEQTGTVHWRAQTAAAPED